MEISSVPHGRRWRCGRAEATTSTRGAGQEAVQPQGDLELEGPVRFLPARAEHLGDTLEPLVQGVGMDVEGRARAGVVTGLLEVGLEGQGEVALVLEVVCEERAHRGLHERREPRSPGAAEERAVEPELVAGAAGPGTVEGDEQCCGLPRSSWADRIPCGP